MLLLVVNAVWFCFLSDDFKKTSVTLKELQSVLNERKENENRRPREEYRITNLKERENEFVHIVRPVLEMGKIHFLYLIATALIAVLVGSITITYFIGTSRWCQEVVDAYALDPALAERSRQFKRYSFPWALGGIAVVVGVVATGGAANPSVRLDNAAPWITPCQFVSIMGSVLIGFAFWKQSCYLANNFQIIQEIVSEVRRVRAERGLIQTNSSHAGLHTTR